MATTRKTTTTAKTNTAEEAVTVKETANKPIVPKDIDTSMEIPVRSAFQGDMLYTNRHGEEYNWKEFGDVIYMELAELRIAKNTARKFFVNNWITFDEGYEWVPEYLGIGELYKNSLSAYIYDDVFKKKPDEIEEIISGMTDAQKNTLKYRAFALVDEGIIDSRKVINTLEDCLGVELIEK